MFGFIFRFYVCLILLQLTNAKSIEKDFKALKAKLSEDAAVYKALEAKVVERERVGKYWFISCLFLYCSSILFLVRRL